jgi:threonine/homoserine/homoserine lactone efflux protein
MQPGPGTMTNDHGVVFTTLALYLAVVVSPGPSFALVSRMAAAGERRAALGATVGLAGGATVYAVLTMAGLAVVLAEIGWLAWMLQVGGGAYLLHLGIRTWRGVERPLQAPDAAGDVSSAVRGVWRGFVMSLSNPKAIAFFVGLYAAAVPTGTATWAKVAILAGGFAIEIGWYGLVTLLLSGRQVRSLYMRGRGVIERAVGALLVVVGCRLILEKV